MPSRFASSTPRRTRRSASLGLLACLALLTATANGQIGRSLPADIIRAPNPSAAQISTIESFVADRAAALTGSDASAARRARDELEAPLASPSLSVGFRQAYARVLMPSVSQLLKADDPAARATGLRLAGALATDAAVREIIAVTRSDDEGLRLLAATRLGRVLKTLNSGARGPTEVGAQDAIDALGDLLENAKSPVLADAAVRGLEPATSLSAADLASVRNRALAVLGDRGARRARALPTAPKSSAQELLVLVRANALMRQAVTTPNARTSPEAAKGGVALGAAAIGYVTRRLEAGHLPAGTARQVDMELLRAGETVLFYARQSHERAVNQGETVEQTTLAELLVGGKEREFRTQVSLLIGKNSALVESYRFVPTDRFLP